MGIYNIEIQNKKMAKKMTYGEAHIAEQFSIELKNGKFKALVKIKNKPKPMEHDEAVAYYNTKFFKYWVERLNNEIPKKKRKGFDKTKLNETYIKVRMFGTPKNAKLLKESEPCGV